MEERNSHRLDTTQSARRSQRPSKHLMSKTQSLYKEKGRPKGAPDICLQKRGAYCLET